MSQRGRIADQYPPLDWSFVEELPGWLDRNKAMQMHALVIKQRLTNVVELGVYGGRSLVTLAHAARYIGGAVIGIDPWDPGFVGPTAREVYGACQGAIDKLQLSNVCLLRCRSADVVRWPVGQPIDLLHIDGNHVPPMPVADVMLWTPRVRAGGYIWMDDCFYPGVVPACRLLEERWGAISILTTDLQRNDPEGNRGGHCLYQLPVVA